MNTRCAIPILLSVWAVTTLIATHSLVGQAAPAAETTAAAHASFGKLPLYFVENRGVYPEAVKYYIQGADKTLFFTDDGVTFALRGKDSGWTVKLDFVGANPEARPMGRAKQRAVISHFRGPETDWKVGLPTFAQIIYSDLWPGIDLAYRGTVNELKYEFVVAPGADPKQIRLRYRGVEKLERTDTGALRVATPEGGFEDAPPVAWQEIDGERVPVDMAYALGGDGAFGFDVGEYDRTRPLVLDPAILVYCGYIGGSGQYGGEFGTSITVDAAGYAYVTGSTDSTQASFPVTVGPFRSYSGFLDAFVAKVNPQGTALVYCGYIGGSGSDRSSGIAVDAHGNAHVAGSTSSTDLPVKAGPDLTHNGGTDAFVAKVKADGTALLYCGYIGGNGNNGDWANEIAVDAAGNAYVSGWTTSTETSFPVRVGPDLTYNGGFSDAFVAKVNAQGTALAYCGYIGGTDYDYGRGVAVDAAGYAYVTGSTDSTEASFPVKAGPDLTHNGGSDAFVAKINPAGTAFVYCGYVGGAMSDGAWRGIAVDAAGNAYVTGSTNSTEASFPVKAGPDLTYNGGTGDAFVAKVKGDGMALIYCGYIGGSGNEWGLDIAIDAAGSAYVSGWTYSTETSFPVAVGPDLTHNGGGRDAFVAKVNAQGAALVYCGYIGGAGEDRGHGIAVDAAGNAYVTGMAASSQASFPVTVGPDLTHNGLQDGFVAKVALTLLEGSGTPRPGSTVTLTVTATDDVGLFYQLGSSFGTGPIQIGSRKLGLGVDDLLVVSVRGFLPAIFVNYAGVIGTNGQANAKINIPNWSALVGQNIHTAFVTLSTSASQGIKSIANTYSFQIVP